MTEPAPNDEIDPAVLAIDATPDLLRCIADTISMFRPRVQADGGDLSFVELDRNIVRVNLTGACTHCSLAGQTLGAVRRALMEATGLPLRVAPALSRAPAQPD